jgi:hypothetical protein
MLFYIFETLLIFQTSAIFSNSTFDFHSIALIVGFGLLLPHAVYFQKQKYFKLHILFNFLSLIMSLIGTVINNKGLYAIYTLKEKENKAHFTSIHSIIGICVILLQFSIFSGTFFIKILLGFKVNNNFILGALFS